MIRKLSEKAGIDKAIALTILSRLIQAAGGIGSIVFIAKYLTPNEQGYYYTFASIIAIQVFFELGLSGIITQYTAHEFAHLNWKNGKLEGDEYYKSRLSSLLHFCTKWFGLISIFLFFLLAGVGFYFFNKFNEKLNIEWEIPWIVLCISTSLNLFIDPILAYFDGLGEVKDMAQVRLVQKTAMILLLFLFFVFGFKLYSGALASLFSILINYCQILFSDRVVKLRAIWRLKFKWKIEYMKEIFPLQWKIALSWISGYFIFQLFNPVLFATEGPKTAGQMGMTLQALNGISSISMSWISTKVPFFSSLIAKRKFTELDFIFKKTMSSLFVVSILLLIFFNLALIVLEISGSSYHFRFLPLKSTLLLTVACIFNLAIFCWSTYLRCHKNEPFLVLSIVFAILTSCSTFFLGNYYGLLGIVSGYTLLVIVSAYFSYRIFRNKRLEWHKN